MKKFFFTLVIALMTVATSFAMSESKIRQNARFLSDRMAYELDLTPMQYDDCYEVNYDFIYRINRVMDDVVLGYRDAVDYYYNCLDDRNDDLRYILTRSQYTRFLDLEYFYRPIYTSGSRWSFRIHTIYSNWSFFYFDVPTGFRSYAGAHARTHYAHGFYVDRYHSHVHYDSPVHIHGSNNYSSHRRNDFGSHIHDRNSGPQNHYSNPNQNNRQQDPRYHDNSGNHNSPAINNRNGNVQGGNRNEGGRNGQTGSNRNGNSSTRTPSQTQSGGQRSTGSAAHSGRR